MGYQNFLVIQTAFIGDAILASSLLEKLHDRFPDAKISLLVRKGNESLYANHPYLHELLVWDKQTDKIKNLFALLGKIRRQKYDCVINCHRFASSGFLTAFSGAKHSAGYKQNPFSFAFNTAIKHQLLNGKHETERYNELIEDFTDRKLYRPKLYPSVEDLEKVKPYIEANYVCIAPASVWFTKQMPVNKWIELCDQLDPAQKIYLVGAPGDKAVAEAIIQGSKHGNITNLCGDLTLLQTCALMAQAQMNYVNDSAPLHLASSANAPVTAYFLSTLPLFGFGPLSDKSVIKEVRNVKCRPCGIHGHKACPEGHFNCAQQMIM